MSRARHILVLGSSGFIGTAVLDALLLTNAKISLLLHRNKTSFDLPGWQIYHGSLERFDWNLLNEDPPTHIIHLARINSRRFGKWGRYLAALKGAAANKRLLKHLKEQNWNCTITYVSGSLMYGDCGEIAVFEEQALNPVSFARQYYRAEAPFLDYPNIQMVRVPWVFGEGSWFEGFYKKPMKNQGKVACYGPGNNLMSFIEVFDAGRAIVKLAVEGKTGVHHIAMEKSMTQLDFCKLLSKISDLPIEIIPLPELKKRFEPAIYEAFTSSISLQSQTRQQWEAQLQFKEVAEMVEAYLEPDWK